MGRNCVILKTVVLSLLHDLNIKDRREYMCKQLIECYMKVAHGRSVSGGRIPALECECWKYSRENPLSHPISSAVLGGGGSLAVEFIRICRHARDSEDGSPTLCIDHQGITVGGTLALWSPSSPTLSSLYDQAPSL